MFNIKKLLALILSAMLVLCLALSITSCGDGESGGEGEGSGETGGEGGESRPCNHFDLDGDGKCDSCGEDYEESVSESTVTVIARDESGNALVGVTVVIYDNGYEMGTSETDANGSAVFTLPVGSYTVTLSELPEYWTAGMKLINADEKTLTVEITAVDNTPDGSASNPFFVGDEEVEFTIPANTVFNFFVKGINRTLKVYGDGVKVIYNGDDYPQPSDGPIEVFIVGTSDTYSNTPFAIRNLTDLPVTVTVHFESAPGSQANPFEAELDTDYQPSVPRDTTVYYLYTAESDGMLWAYSSDTKNNIMLYNLTTFAATAFTNGESVVYIPVRTGDEISVSVAHSSSDSVYSPSFKLGQAAGTSTDPIPMLDDAFSIKFSTGASYFFKYTGSGAALTVDSTDVTVSVNGTSLESDGSEYSATLADGDLITVTSIREDNIDVELKITASSEN